MLLQLEHEAQLNIPAGDSHFVIEDELRLPIAVYALGIYPHAHYLGKQLEAWSMAPDGARTPLIRAMRKRRTRKMIPRPRQRRRHAAHMAMQTVRIYWQVSGISCAFR
jgi:hypothetical protein